MHSEKGPLVSVLMTAYNREKYIAEAIESVLVGTYTNFELIILDDASIDKTVEIAKAFEKKDERVKVYVNDKNLGQFPNRNKIIKFAKGEYLKYFDSDDIMKPNCLSIMVSAMEEFPEAFAGGEHYKEVEKLPVIYTPRQLYINHYFEGNDLLFDGPSGVIFRKQIFEELEGFDEKIGILADTLFMLKIAAKYPVIGFQPHTFIWRRHDQQISVEQSDIIEMTIQRGQINQIVIQNLDCPFNNRERKIVERNLKNILVRNFIKYIFNRKFEVAKQIFVRSSLSLSDVFFAIFPNRKFAD